MAEIEKKFTILLVDDNPNNLNVLFKALSNENYKLLAAKNGEEAIKRAEYALPDLILLDVLMPGINGFETCKLLKENEKTREIPVIFMTALSETENKVKGFEAGAVDYVTKPIQYEEVLLRVQTHLTIQELKKSLQEKNKELEERNQLLDYALQKEMELNKLKSRFIYLASHDLKNPLSIIILMSRMLSDELEPGEEDKYDKLEKIIKSGKFISQLLDDILLATIADEEELKFNPNPIDIVRLCRDIAGDYQLINSGHLIKFETENINGPVLADERLLVHIINNLLSNCIKYSPKGSEVFFKALRENYQIFLIFKDQGIGISNEDQKVLFEEFKRGTNVGKISGSGLGLSIVKRCAAIHNGEISFESELGKGTTTTFKFPVQH